MDNPNPTNGKCMIRFLIFFLIITLVLSGATFYVAHFFTRHGWLLSHRRTLWILASAFILLQILGPLLYRFYPDRSAGMVALSWLTYVTLGFFACLFFFTVAADLFFLAKAWAFRDGEIDPDRRNLLIVGGLALGSTIAGAAQALRGPQIYSVEVPIKGLPKNFDGFKIAQVSDLHVGPLIDRTYANDVVQKTLALDADLIALTGDFADGNVEALREHMAPLAQLKAPHGVYFVSGNHEYYWGAESWIEEHRRLGARVLENEHVILTKDGQDIALGGVPDLQMGKPDAKKAFQGAPEGIVKILLAHQPAFYSQAETAGVHLQLSGHTHGGQFFPWSILVRSAQRYCKGLYRHSETLWVYVNRGTGYWGPPLRFLVPAEISLIRLKSV